MDLLESWTPIAKVYHPLSCGSIDGTDDYPHDRGVLRALNSRYEPNKQVLGDPLCTIFVGRLNPETTEDALFEVFSEYGSIKRMRLVRDIISGFSKRYAFIEYKSGSSARKAASRGDKIRLDDRELLVDMECERELKGWIPRRLGGGFGGKKESGQLRFGGKDRPFRKPIIFTTIERASGSHQTTRRLPADTGYGAPHNAGYDGSHTSSSSNTPRREQDYRDSYRDRSLRQGQRSPRQSQRSPQRDQNSYSTYNEQEFKNERRGNTPDIKRSNSRTLRDRSRSPDKKLSKHKHKSKKHRHRSRSSSRDKDHKRSRRQ